MSEAPEPTVTLPRALADDIHDGLSIMRRSEMVPAWSIMMPCDPEEAIAAIHFLRQHCEDVEICYGAGYEGSAFCDIIGWRPKITAAEARALLAQPQGQEPGAIDGSLPLAADGTPVQPSPETTAVFNRTLTMDSSRGLLLMTEHARAKERRAQELERAMGYIHEILTEKKAAGEDLELGSTAFKSALRWSTLTPTDAG